MPPTPRPEPDDDDLVWEAPPKRGKAKVVDEIAELVPKLKRHPGEWARLRVFGPKHSAANYVKALREAFPDIEFVSGFHLDGSAIWGRAPKED